MCKNCDQYFLCAHLSNSKRSIFWVGVEYQRCFFSLLSVMQLALLKQVVRTQSIFWWIWYSLDLVQQGHIQDTHLRPKKSCRPRLSNYIRPTGLSLMQPLHKGVGK